MADVLSDVAFRQEYAKAVQGLSPEELQQVAALSSKRLYQWVMSPTEIRSLLLAQWEREDSDKGDFRDSVKSKVWNSIDIANESVAEALKQHVEEVEARVAKKKQDMGWFARFLGKLV